MTTRERERLHVDAIEEVQQLDLARRALRDGDTAGAERALEEARRRRFRHATPVPVSVAARLLKVSVPTVRSWATEGILADAGTKPQAVTLESVARIVAELKKLREQGRDREFRTALLTRLDDEITLQDRHLQESLDQMRRGRGRRSVVAGPDR